MKWIDLRSDTVTMPTDEMRMAMASAEMGDDVYEDDPTVARLERLAADMTGKEAALFVPTGTFGNQMCLFVHCLRGDEVLLGDNSHIFIHEVGASAVIAGVQLRTFSVKNGYIDPGEIKAKIRALNDIHNPRTGLICIENALGNGKVMTPENMKDVYEVAKAHELPVHLDGARVFNAALSLGVGTCELTKYCDSVMFCLSKGLCAPVGSMVAGTKDFIAKARKARKLMGGGMRQVGVLAAAGIIALEKMTLRLGEDHDNAKYLGEQLAGIEGIEVLEDNIDVNMVFFSMKGTGYNSFKLEKDFLQKGIKINPEEDGLVRFVTNNDVTTEDIDFVITTFRDVLKMASNGRTLV